MPADSREWKSIMSGEDLSQCIEEAFAGLERPSLEETKACL
jgi:hypothetical protein